MGTVTDPGNLKAFVEASSSRVKMAEETRHYMEGEVERLKATLREEQVRASCLHMHASKA